MTSGVKREISEELCENLDRLDLFERQKYQCGCDMIMTAKASAVGDDYARLPRDCEKLKNEVYVEHGKLAVRGTTSTAWKGKTLKSEVIVDSDMTGAKELSTEQCENVIKPMYKKLRDTFEQANFVVQGEKNPEQLEKGLAACAALDTYEATVEVVASNALASVTAGSTMHSGLIATDQDLGNVGVHAVSAGGSSAAYGTGGIAGDTFKALQGINVGDIAGKAAGGGVQKIVDAFHRGLRLVAQKNQREVNLAVDMPAICDVVKCLSGGGELRDVTLTNPCTGTRWATYRVSEDCPQCGCPKKGCTFKRVVAMCPPLQEFADDLAQTCKSLFVDDVFQITKFTRLTASTTTAGRFSRTMYSLSEGIRRFVDMEESFVRAYFDVSSADTTLERTGGSAAALSDAVSAFYEICGHDADISVLEEASGASIVAQDPI
eukprot:g4431.t1